MPEYYRDDAVLIPGRGAVLIAEAGTEPPTADDLDAWVKAGAVGALNDFVPIGYTSIDELPGFDSDVEGGEKKGAWENDSLRQTAVKTTDTVNVQPIQWSETPLTHRFGPGVIDGEKGHFEVPAAYTATEVALLIVLIDGNDNLGIHIWKAASAPGDGIEFDAEEFAALPITYTVLQYASAEAGRKTMTIIANWLKGAADGGDNGGGEAGE